MSEDVEARIRQAVMDHGPIGFDEFMELALYGPGGFFEAPPVGARGHFVTSPHVHPFVFSHCLRDAMLDAWHALGEPDPFPIVELGAGDGTLAGSLLEAFAELPRPRIEYTAVEISPGSREALEAGGLRAVSRLEEIDPFEGVALANELLDNLPFLRTRGVPAGVAEVRIGLDADRLVEVEMPWERDDLPPPALERDQETTVPVGSFELLEELSATMRRGYVVLIDYGTVDAPVGPARGYADQRLVTDLLSAPGDTDITAGVDVARVAAHAERFGLRAFEPIAQADALPNPRSRPVGADDARAPVGAPTGGPRHRSGPRLASAQPGEPARRALRVRRVLVAGARDRRAARTRLACSGHCIDRTSEPSLGSNAMAFAAGRRRSGSMGLAVLLSLMLFAAACTGSDPSTPGSARAGEPVDEGLAEELEEQAEKTEKRLEALEEAREAGTLGVTEPIERHPAPGWAGERVVHRTGDDWEPAIAADPNRPFVYLLHNRYGGKDACANDCPDPAMILHVSRDGGRTWKPERYLCVCRGWNAQYDPLIEVVPETSDVVAVWMNQFKIHFSRSTDHGRTWSKAVFVHPDVRWGDKPNFTVSPDGQDVYIHFNGPSGGDAYVAVSHDGGVTWSTSKITETDRYYFSYGTAVLPTGRVVLTQVSFSYTGPGGAAEGVQQVHVFTSDDDGATWSELVLEELELGVECVSEGCYDDYYDSGPALAADENGDLVIVYNGASAPFGPQTVFARSSTDGGTTWSDAVTLSKPGVNSAFPAAVGDGDDGARVWYMVQRSGKWQVVYRTTGDLGLTWGPRERLSDAVSGTAYKHRHGFNEVYGDYGEIAITSEGNTVATWGEGTSYVGPGGVWFNREL